MSAPLLMVLATLLFAVMGVAVKYASAHYGAGELVFYRSAIGIVLIGSYARWRGITMRTPVPAMHAWRSATGVSALALWFYAIEGLPLGTAMALNYMSSVWMALFLLGGAVWLGASRVDSRLIAAVLVGFAGVALVLRPTVQTDQALYGLGGLASGLLAIGTLATVAQTLMTRAYTLGATLTNASLQYLGIVFASLFGVWLFDDALGWSAVSGIALIIAAGLAATYLQARTPRDSSASTMHPPEA